MVNYQCPICLKEFHKKYNFEMHTKNKKNPCQPIKNPILQTRPKTPENSMNYLENDKNIFSCNYCCTNFTRKDNLTKHLNNSCKVKKEMEAEKEKMFKLMLEHKNDEIKDHKEIISKLESMINQQNDKITALIKKIKPSKITNNNTMNNIVIKTSMNKFGEENLEKLLNKKHFEDNILMLTGSNAFQACADMIYNNPKYPENQTVFCTDLSREKFMVYNGKDWIPHTRTQVFTEVQNKIQEYIDMHEEELQEKLNKDAKFKEKFFNRVGKFYKKYYGNKHEKDSEFENKTDEQLMRFFYSIKEFVKNNYNLLYDKALETERKKKLELEDIKDIKEIKDEELVETPKKRGRPKKIEIIN